MRVVENLLLVFLMALAVACGHAEPSAAGSAKVVPLASHGASQGATTSAPPPGTAAPSLPATPEKITPLAAGATLAVGVTMHPYYSWVKNVVGDEKTVEVRAVLPGEVDAGDYQPSPADIKKLADLDALVVNGIGHDDFIGEMVAASGNTKLAVIHANDGTPLMKQAHGDAMNSHTFISFTNAIQETYAIAKILGALRPDLADTFEKNAGEYARRLRKIKAAAADKLADAKVHRVVTVHDGYGYLCQEFGIEVAGVVQPAHGLTPSANELGEMVDLLKREKITVVLTEESFPEKMLDVLKAAGPVKVYVISHIAKGQYSASEFEDVMQANASTLVRALVTDPVR